MILVEVHTDDYELTVSFDATPFFERATLREIVALKSIGWGGDYQADAVALYMQDKAPSVAAVLNYTNLNPTMYNGFPMGFECHVREEDVVRWVKINRPVWFHWLFEVAKVRLPRRRWA